jgi:hypothetical protein
MPDLNDFLQLLSRFVPQQLQQQQPQQARQMPGPGFIPGQLTLNQKLAPSVPVGAARPFGPGEFISNPGGGQSNEITLTIPAGDYPSFNNGQAAVLPSLWIKDGKAYVARNEDEAVALAQASGLTFQGFPTTEAAEAFAVQREQNWQGMQQSEADQVARLYQPQPKDYIEPPPAPSPASPATALSTVPPAKVR